MMKAFKHGRLYKVILNARSGLWFLPAIIVLGFIGLAMGLVALDVHLGDPLAKRWPLFFGTEAEGARSMLSSIATSLATIVGVVFSVTVVALTLASSQYTSRAMRNFMRDRVNQVVLGVLVGAHVYCLLVLKAIGANGESFVPSIATACAVPIGVVALGYFTYFIHHISTSIQVSKLASTIAADAARSIDDTYPAPLRSSSGAPPTVTLPPSLQWYPVYSGSTGYIERVDMEGLVELAGSRDIIVHVLTGSGDFVTPEFRPVVSIAMSAPPDEHIVAKINELFIVGTYRTIEQDPAFGIRQLVDISLRALSPGVNDTTTAITCIDYLSYLLARAAGRDMTRCMGHTELPEQIIPKVTTFPELLELAFDQILESAPANTEVLMRILIALRHIGEVTFDRNRRGALAAYLEVVSRVAYDHPRSEYSTRKFARHLAETRKALQ